MKALRIGVMIPNSKGGETFVELADVLIDAAIFRVKSGGTVLIDNETSKDKQ